MINLNDAYEIAKYIKDSKKVTPVKIYVNGNFLKFEKTISETDAMVLTTTELLQEVWKNKLEDNTNPFDEALEQMWIRQWLFYTNSVRYASAMTGAADYATFKNGWWFLSETLQHMKEWMELKKEVKE